MTIPTPALTRPQKERGPIPVILGYVILGLLLATAIIAPLLFGESANRTDPMSSRLSPSAEHIFGTDQLGRDIFSRTLVATGTSLSLALGATLITTVAGTLLGLFAAGLGSRARQVTFQIAATMTAFPAILLAVILATLFGRSGIAAMLGLAIAGIPYTLRVTMTLTVSAFGADQVTAARVVGVPHRRLMLRYVLPQIAEPLATISILSASSYILAISALSFVGLGVQPPSWDWGSMLNEGMSEIYTNPFGIVGPALAIVLAGVALNVVGEHLARYLNPRHRGSGVRPAKAQNTSLIEIEGALREVPVKDQILKVENLNIGIKRSKHTLVHNVDFVVSRGERVGIVGESGSGKSLTLSAMGDLLQLGLSWKADSLHFDGVELHSMSPRERSLAISDRIAMIFQDQMSSLNPSLRIESILMDKLRAHSTISHDEARRACLEALESVSLPDPEDTLQRYPHQLSGGQQQRVMIAMTLLGNTEVILADEPTTALDVSVQHQIANLLVDVSVKKNISLILVSHDISLVSQVCDRIVVMTDGRIVEQGTTEQVLTQPKHPYTVSLLQSLPPQISRSTVLEGERRA